MFKFSNIASPSIESFSTLPDQEDLEFSLDADAGDLQVRVDNPQKHLDTLETYVTFRICTRVNIESRVEYKESEYSVRRRYNDFVWLRQKLVESFPTHLIPPLPGKHTLLAQLDRYSKNFVLARLAMLHRFLTRVVAHPVLSYNMSLYVFLTAKPSEFNIHRKSGQGILGRVTDSLQNLTTNYLVRQRSPEFDSVRDYANTLGEKLTQLEKVGRRLQKERQAYQGELNQFQQLFTVWATSEPELRPLLLAFASAIERNTASQQNTLLDSFSATFEQPLKEYLLYVDAVKEALQRRDAVQIEYELAVDELNKKRNEKEQLVNLEGTSGGASSAFNLWKKPAEARDEKIEKLSQLIPNLVRQAEANQDKMQCANENLRSDLERWHVEKKKDIRNLLLCMANQQIQYYEDVLSSWEQVIPEVKCANQTAGSSAAENIPASSSMQFST
ncbi:sorting nexin-30-like isoform X2 [Thrips palmi]|uniref:Sorting nexin-30-like isoform X2 n=1 Tax=Thrips palmi TaxID=161013 RepID=A0A6P9ACW0_THRPL|nr:sorting nexin-30-like isoform X2 [Thrips palmi]